MTSSNVHVPSRMAVSAARIRRSPYASTSSSGSPVATSSASRLRAEDVRPDLRVEVAAPLVGRA